MKQINDRKSELESEINRVEEKYSSKAVFLQKSVKSALKPVQKIRDKPFTAVGLSVIAGFVAGYSGRKKRPKIHKRDRTPIETENVSGSGFTSVLTTELKKFAARKAMVFITDWVDQQLIPELTNRVKNREGNTGKNNKESPTE
ncbi:MAG: hypothetical protein R6V27_15050 [Balneolaceae bacterium]